MTRTFLLDLSGLFPEIILGCLILGLLVFSVCMTKQVNPHVPQNVFIKIMVLVMLSMGILMMFQDLTPLYIFNGLFVRDAFTVFMKLFVIAAAFCVYLSSLSTFKIEGLEKPEFSLLILIALLGMFLVISANDFMALYMGLELQSLALYILVAFKKDSIRSSEAAVKFFILGAMASAILLFGLSLIYGVVGSLNFQDVGHIFKSLSGVINWSSPHIIFGGFVGLTFVLVAFLFKISAAPFHMWAPDVYEGATLPVMAFLALVPKIAAVSMILRAAISPFVGLLDVNVHGIMEFFPTLMIGSALLSIIIGTFGALAQRNIKRLLAYSGISHMGYVLMGISIGNYEGVQAALLYLMLYVIMGIGVFAYIGALRYPLGHSQIGLIQNIKDLKGLAVTHPRIALGFSVLMFSFAGIPPLAGFFAKFYILLRIIDAGYIGLSIIVILLSVVGAFYYLRIVKYIYFDEPVIILDAFLSRSSFIPLMISLSFTVLFFMVSMPFLWYASFVATALFRG